MKRESFQIYKTPTLKVSNVFCDLLIQPSDINVVVVEIEGEDEDIELVKINQSGDQIVISQQQRRMNGAIYINTVGKVFVNGREVQISGEVVTPEPLKITVNVPVGTYLDAEMNGSTNLIANVSLGKADIHLSGSSQFDLTEVQDLTLNLSGSVQGEVRNVLGDLDINASGSVKLELLGTFRTVNIDSHGTGSITTHGTCNGDYIINASGMCRITHEGSVNGRLRKKTSGMCKVNV